MTPPDEDLLATEGVDEGSAASTVEGSTAEGAGTAERAGPPADPPAVPHAPDDAESRPAPPDEVDTAEARAARAAGSGQELEAGEG